MKKTRVLYLRRNVLAAAGCLAAALLMCWLAASPKAVGASASVKKRQLPIYCVEKDYKVVSISFDAAWGNEDTQHGLARVHVGKQSHRQLFHAPASLSSFSFSIPG